jgi:uncharacterized surface protein with fasciclin (FAS1) repeats
LLADKEQLSAVLLYHVIGDQVLASADLLAGELATAQSPCSSLLADNVVTVNDATAHRCRRSSLRTASCMLIHKVLLPPAEAAGHRSCGRGKHRPLEHRSNCSGISASFPRW